MVLTAFSYGPRPATCAGSCFQVCLMKLTTKLRAFVIVLLAVVVTGSLWFIRRSDFTGPNIRQIILISIDTCRPDYLSCYGYPRRTTPNIDAVARQAVRFEQTITPAPTTLPAHSSMLSGTIPPYHGVRNNIDYKFRDRNTSIAEILRKYGYKTGAIISSFVLDAQFGLNQGFKTYNDDFIESLQCGEYTERRANETSNFACEWLQEHRKDKFFLFLHYYDPHDPYVPPEPFASRFSDNLYAGEIAYADHHIGRVIEKLKELGLYDSALIIIVADHGESLGEHEEETHGYFIYQSTVRIPLIIKPPGGCGPSVVSRPVAVIDIVPTILGTLQIPVPPEVQGNDLSGLFTEKQHIQRNTGIYCESVGVTNYGCNPLFGVVQDQWKYIKTTKPELYELTRDPGETKNLVETEPERAQALQARLKRILSEQSYPGEDGSKTVLDRRSLQRLESLGYIGVNRASENFEFDPSKDDAKDLIGFYNLHLKLNKTVKEKNYDEIEELCREMLRQQPDFVHAYRYLGGIAMERNEPAKAVDYFEKALRFDNNSPVVHDMMAGALIMLGRFNEAAKHSQEALRLNPEDPRYLNGFGKILAGQGKLEQSIDTFKKALEIDPDNADAYHNIGNVLAFQGRLNEAAEYWRESLRLKPDQPELRQKLEKTSQ
jgi:arylsulfatase A-like enzyme